MQRKTLTDRNEEINFPKLNIGGFKLLGRKYGRLILERLISLNASNKSSIKSIYPVLCIVFKYIHWSKAYNEYNIITVH